MSADENTGQTSLEPFQRQPGGVFITAGMQLRIPSLTLSLDGEIQSSMEVHVSFDVCPSWLDIARRHFLDADVSRQQLVSAWQTPDDERVRVALENEFESSMQAIISAAIAMDAFYASVKERIEIPQTVREAWKNKRTARHAQISEVLRLAFKISSESFETVKTGLKQLMKFRDNGVHPPVEHTAPIQHPVLQVGTEWRFIAFRVENAKAAVQLSLSIIAQLLNRPKANFPELVRYCEGVRPRVMPIVAAWEEQFGFLFSHGS
jgi:hypothetical protein